MKQQYENSWYCVFVINTSIFSTALMIAFAMSSLNPLVPVIQQIYNTTYVERHGGSIPDETWTLLLTLTMSMLMVGAFCGAVSFKFAITYLTRNQVMLTTHSFAVIGYVIIGVGSGVWGSYEAFITGRFVTGISFGLALSVVPLIINESSVPHRRQLYGGALGTALQTGVVIAIFFAWSKILGTYERWIGVIILGTIYSLAYFVCAFWITETPFQTLILRGEDEALKVLRRLRRGSESDLMEEIRELVANAAGQEEESSTATFMEVIKTPQYRRHFIGAAILFAFLMASGINNIFFYSDEILRNAGLDEEVVTPATLGVMLSSPILSVILIFFIERGLEPRILLIVGCAVLIAGDAFITACLATLEEVPAMSTAAIAAVCIFYIGFTIINLVCFLLIGAITIDRTRTVCTNIGGICLWFFAWFVGFMAPYFQIWIGPYGFLIWMGLTILVMLYVIFFIPNVRGKSQREIQQFYKTRFTSSPSTIPVESSI